MPQTTSLFMQRGLSLYNHLVKPTCFASIRGSEGHSTRWTTSGESVTDVKSEPDPASQNGTPWNAINLSFLISVAIFVALGYHLAAGHGFGFGFVGAILGVVLAVVATPLVFVLLMCVAHVVIKLEEAISRFHR